MMTNSISAILLAMVLGSCTVTASTHAQEEIVPSKNYITQKVKVENFEGIQTSTSIDVIYTQTTGETDVEVYAPDNLMEYVKVVSDGHMLKVYFESKEKGKSLNIRGKHGLQPIFHFICGDIGGIRNNGIIKIQHQQPDALALQKFRGQVGQCRGDHPRQKREIHITTPFRILCKDTIT